MAFGLLWSIGMRWQLRPGRNRVGGLKVFPRRALWAAPRGMCVVQTRLTFPPFLVEKACFSSPFHTSIAGLPVVLMFGPAPKRNIFDARAANPYATMGSFMQMPVTETDNCMLVFGVPGGTEEAAPIVQQFSPEIYAWRERLFAWGDLVTQQDPVPVRATEQRRVYAKLQVGRRAWLQDVDAGPKYEDGIESMHSLRPGLTLTPIELQQLLDWVETAVEVPFAWSLMRLALASAGRTEYRLAVLEAGTASELALTELLRKHLEESPKGSTSVDTDKWTLGRLLKEYVKMDGPLPAGRSEGEFKTDLVDVRNAAVHRGQTTPVTADLATTLAHELVELAYPLPPLTNSS